MIWMSGNVEEAAEHQPYRMRAGLMTEPPGGTEERSITLVDQALARYRLAGMQIDRDG
ncbi:Uncharacterised protein [Mycobacteroides abscessus]|nr:Uncharacterised protein [Mycobacteroides abscessus]